MRKGALLPAMLIASLLLFGLAACAGAGTSTTSPSPTPETTAPLPSPTPEPSPSPQPTATNVPSPTPTAAPTPAAPEKIEPEFVDNADCAAIADRELSQAEVEVSNGAKSRDILAEIADAPESRQQGLMCRSIIPQGTGMLFQFSAPRGGGFWMFNTYVPIDIIYINGEQANSIVTMYPCPRKTGESQSEWDTRCGQASAFYRAAGEFDAALELPQGWLDRAFGLLDPADVTVKIIEPATG
jgi:uncharacterized membrane protein (UPF0127 family)